ncbi:MAG: hypothetical protein JO115_09475 [Pseudonocardiales bacterium]|nr:hypothetical protein [Pseudonocardiales bacterium]
MSLGKPGAIRPSEQEMSIEPPRRHGEHEAGRMAVQGRRTDNTWGFSLLDSRTQEVR